MTLPISQLTARPVLEFTSAEVAEAMNRSFEEYFVPMHFDAASFERRFRSEHLDPAASRLWFQGDALVGVVFIARRGWQSRVAAMGLVREFRHQGLGKIMLQTALEEARTRGDQTMLLEVFTVNEPAIRLYERLGFVRCRELAGFRQEAGAATPTETLTEIDPLRLAQQVQLQGDANLPWMLGPETLTAATHPHKAYRLQEHAYALVRPEADKAVVLCLLVAPASRRQGWGTRLVRALEAEFGGLPLVFPPLVPQAAGIALLESCGWQRSSLALYEMSCALN